MNDNWVTLPVSSIVDIVVDEGANTVADKHEVDEVRQAMLGKLRENDDELMVLGLQTSDLPPAFRVEDPQVRLVISARRKRPTDKDEAFCGVAFYSEDGRALTEPYLVCDHGIPTSLWKVVIAFANSVGLHDPAPDEPLSTSPATMRTALERDGVGRVRADPRKGRRWRTTPFEAAGLN